MVSAVEGFHCSNTRYTCSFGCNAMGGWSSFSISKRTSKMIFNKTGASIGVGVTLSPPQTVSHGHVWKRGRVRKEKVWWQSGMPGTQILWLP